eukprot:MONOS_4632.1-p1 / transcript=MONOS_4632.1 / gene=MONOS_4632 / organism=Monocercomonoides_exilis_PA203 / gene_product=unspecified product / transcript_product=unspecified product / location=Mono_scaffold00125:53360-60769(-) / protein_length=2470 / sequence_SO=supercontig / SO=protein_coding / is_pseudo=false
MSPSKNYLFSLSNFSLTFDSVKLVGNTVTSVIDLDAASLLTLRDTTIENPISKTSTFLSSGTVNLRNISLSFTFDHDRTIRSLIDSKVEAGKASLTFSEFRDLQVVKGSSLLCSPKLSNSIESFVNFENISRPYWVNSFETKFSVKSRSLTHSSRMIGCECLNCEDAFYGVCSVGSMGNKFISENSSFIRSFTTTTNQSIGSALPVFQSGTVEFFDCNFSACHRTAEPGGGGICVNGSYITFKLERCIFEDCYVESKDNKIRGGCAYAVSPFGDFAVNNCTFRRGENRKAAYGWSNFSHSGGLVMMNMTTCVMSNCLFDKCRSGLGGALNVEHQKAGTVFDTNNFTECEAYGMYGGCFHTYGAQGEFSFHSCLFQGNKAKTLGGALEMWNSNGHGAMKVSYCYFIGNRVDSSMGNDVYLDSSFNRDTIRQLFMASFSTSDRPHLFFCQESTNDCPRGDEEYQILPYPPYRNVTAKFEGGVNEYYCGNNSWNGIKPTESHISIPNINEDLTYYTTTYIECKTIEFSLTRWNPFINQTIYIFGDLFTEKNLSVDWKIITIRGESFIQPSPGAPDPAEDFSLSVPAPSPINSITASDSTTTTSLFNVDAGKLRLLGVALIPNSQLNLFTINENGYLCVQGCVVQPTVTSFLSSLRTSNMPSSSSASSHFSDKVFHFFDQSSSFSPLYTSSNALQAKTLFQLSGCTALIFNTKFETFTFGDATAVKCLDVKEVSITHNNFTYLSRSVSSGAAINVEATTSALSSAAGTATVSIDSCSFSDCITTEASSTEVGGSALYITLRANTQWKVNGSSFTNCLAPVASSPTSSLASDSNGRGGAMRFVLLGTLCDFEIKTPTFLGNNAHRGRNIFVRSDQLAVDVRNETVPFFEHDQARKYFPPSAILPPESNFNPKELSGSQSDKPEAILPLAVFFIEKDKWIMSSNEDGFDVDHCGYLFFPCGTIKHAIDLNPTTSTSTSESSSPSHSSRVNATPVKTRVFIYKGITMSEKITFDASSNDIVHLVGGDFYNTRLSDAFDPNVFMEQLNPTTGSSSSASSSEWQYRVSSQSAPETSLVKVTSSAAFLIQGTSASSGFSAPTSHFLVDCFTFSLPSIHEVAASSTDSLFKVSRGDNTGNVLLLITRCGVAMQSGVSSISYPLFQVLDGKLVVGTLTVSNVVFNGAPFVSVALGAASPAVAIPPTAHLDSLIFDSTSSSSSVADTVLIDVGQKCSVIVNNSRMTGCHLGKSSFIGANQASNVVLKNSTYQSDQNNNGNGTFVKGNAVQDGQYVVVDGCTFIDCNATGANCGGGCVFARLFDTGNLTVKHSSFRQCRVNQASGRGGAILLILDDSSTDNFVFSFDYFKDDVAFKGKDIFIYCRSLIRCATMARFDFSMAQAALVRENSLYGVGTVDFPTDTNLFTIWEFNRSIVYVSNEIYAEDFPLCGSAAFPCRSVEYAANQASGDLQQIVVWEKTQLTTKVPMDEKRFIAHPGTRGEVAIEPAASAVPSGDEGILQVTSAYMLVQDLNVLLKVNIKYNILMRAEGIDAEMDVFGVSFKLNPADYPSGIPTPSPSLSYSIIYINGGKMTMKECSFSTFSLSSPIQKIISVIPPESVPHDPSIPVPAHQDITITHTSFTDIARTHIADGSNDVACVFTSSSSTRLNLSLANCSFVRCISWAEKGSVMNLDKCEVLMEYCLFEGNGEIITSSSGSEMSSNENEEVETAGESNTQFIFPSIHSSRFANPDSSSPLCSFSGSLVHVSSSPKATFIQTAFTRSPKGALTIHNSDASFTMVEFSQNHHPSFDANYQQVGHNIRCSVDAASLPAGVVGEVTLNSLRNGDGHQINTSFWMVNEGCTLKGKLARQRKSLHFIPILSSINVVDEGEDVDVYKAEIEGSNLLPCNVTGQIRYYHENHTNETQEIEITEFVSQEKVIINVPKADVDGAPNGTEVALCILFWSASSTTPTPSSSHSKSNSLPNDLTKFESNYVVVKYGKYTPVPEPEPEPEPEPDPDPEPEPPPPPPPPPVTNNTINNTITNTNDVPSKGSNLLWLVILLGVLLVVSVVVVVIIILVKRKKKEGEYALNEVGIQTKELLDKEGEGGEDGIEVEVDVGDVVLLVSPKGRGGRFDRLSGEKDDDSFNFGENDVDAELNDLKNIDDSKETLGKSLKSISSSSSYATSSASTSSSSSTSTSKATSSPFMPIELLAESTSSMGEVKGQKQKGTSSSSSSSNSAASSSAPPSKVTFAVDTATASSKKKDKGKGKAKGKPGKDLKISTKRTLATIPSAVPESYASNDDKQKENSSDPSSQQKAKYLRSLGLNEKEISELSKVLDEDEMKMMSKEEILSLIRDSHTSAGRDEIHTSDGSSSADEAFNDHSFFSLPSPSTPRSTFSQDSQRSTQQLLSKRPVSGASTTSNDGALLSPRTEAMQLSSIISTTSMSGDGSDSVNDVLGMLGDDIDLDEIDLDDLLGAMEDVEL